MSRPIPLAIIAFLLGVLCVVMFIAPRYYTIEDAVFSNPDYAQQIVLEANTAELSAASSVDGSSSSPILVLRLKNTGDLTVWGKVECRVTGFSAPIVIPVPILPPNMESFAVYSIPLEGAVLPEGEGWEVRARWAKLYAK